MKHNQFTVTIRFSFTDHVSEEQLAAALVRGFKTKAFGIPGSFLVLACETGTQVKVAPIAVSPPGIANIVHPIETEET